MTPSPPAVRAVPFVGLRSPAIRRSNVVLPAPFGPTRAPFTPLPIRNETSSSRTRPSGSANVRWLTSMTPTKGVLQQERAARGGEFRVAHRLAVVDELRDRDHRDAVLLREQLEVLEACGRAVIVQHFANDRHRRTARKTGQVDGRFGVAAPLDHAAFAGAHGEHMAGPHEVTGA